MEVAIIVGRCCVLSMEQPGYDGDSPYEPRGCAELVGIGIGAEAYRKIYGKKPKVATHSVEDAPYARVLFGHSSELSVGTVKRVGPHEQ